jgi:hypothetical protein
MRKANTKRALQRERTGESSERLESKIHAASMVRNLLRERSGDE